MKRSNVLVSAACAFLLLAALPSQSAIGHPGFHTNCENGLPSQLATLKQTQSTDTACDLNGEAASFLQNAVKNNFCVTAPPTRVIHTTLYRPAQRIEKRLAGMNIAWGRPTVIPSSRYVGFVLDAHHSNVNNGENVNYNATGEVNNDIHISLGPDRATLPCDSVTAELSPHFRPISWTGFDDYWIYHPVRLTGQLFFDACHKPCKPGHPANSARLLSREIHPVYAIDVQELDARRLPGERRLEMDAVPRVGDAAG